MLPCFGELITLLGDAPLKSGTVVDQMAGMQVRSGKFWERSSQSWGEASYLRLDV